VTSPHEGLKTRRWSPWAPPPGVAERSILGLLGGRSPAGKKKGSPSFFWQGSWRGPFRGGGGGERPKKSGGKGKFFFFTNQPDYFLPREETAPMKLIFFIFFPAGGKEKKNGTSND